ncbi:MAG: M15 family metallopeptidase [Plesiomonas sp.]|uniref:M15 family metallopeptidase n=1 Tax=Plesiomonas sp. TaxID=2486279 RepID=UPI003F2C7F71
MFSLSKRSLGNLQGVHPDLVKIVQRAIQITPIDFMVIEGKRNDARQRQLVLAGKSWTRDSRHITGHACDCAPLVGGKIPWNDKGAFSAVAKAMFTAAKELGIVIRWGGDWNENGSYSDEVQRGSYDGPHFELRRAEYPS